MEEMVWCCAVKFLEGMSDSNLGTAQSKLKRIGIAADHGGFNLKEYLAMLLRREGYDVRDFGDLQAIEDDDYPDFVVPLSRAVANGEVERGIAVCGSGVGASVCANKVMGVKACLINDTFSARQGVEDDNLNVICLGGRVIGHSLAWELVQTFLAARFSGAERHRRRLGQGRGVGVAVENPVKSILTINGGYSSVMFAVFAVEEPLKRGLHGAIDRIGLSGTTLKFQDPAQQNQKSLDLAASDHKSASKFLFDWLEKRINFEAVAGVGHRVVHGMRHTAPELVTPELITDLHHISPIDPEHLPQEIALMEAICERYPKLPQVACFDTAFHQVMPRVARLLGFPRRLDALGVQRYGFHGLSYEYLMDELGRLGDPAAKAGRVILAHLGNGASMAAVREGKGIDTSMGFTPTAGLVRSTRCGDMDPGVAAYLGRTEQMTSEQFFDMATHKSGLLGVSETSSDMRDLLEREASDIRAAEAVALFCYHAKKWIGSFAAALGGLDTLVFAGGIGENSTVARARICDGLEFLGIQLDATRNAQSDGVISVEGGRVKIRVIRTDEELVIARAVNRLVG